MSGPSGTPPEQRLEYLEQEKAVAGKQQTDGARDAEGALIAIDRAKQVAQRSMLVGSHEGRERPFTRAKMMLLTAPPASAEERTAA